ncbi:MAG: nuclear transport factor 2 family protein [Myxococcales bacterium]|nr:nuclear transport factor 2 family protein [Myxococcales bacterium]
MLRLHENAPSGNCYKVRLLLTQLGVPFERVPVDILKGESRTPEFLKLNPNGRVPVVQFEDGRTLAESNAILFHFAEGSSLLSADAYERAEVLQWMFFEQYSHEPFIATSRFWLKLSGTPEKFERQLAERRPGGLAALGVMENHLAAHPYFVGGRYTIADIALYAYTHVAPEGGFDLGPYPAVRAWIDRVAAQPRHIRITDEADVGVGERVAAWKAAWESRDVDRIVGLYLPDATHASPAVRRLCPEFADATLRGIDQIRAYATRGLEQFQELRFDLITVIQEGDQAAVEYRRHSNVDGARPTHVLELLEWVGPKLGSVRVFHS